MNTLAQRNSTQKNLKVRASETKDAHKAQSPIKVCMHRLGSAYSDILAMHPATALVKEGYTVSIVDIETERTRPSEETVQGVHLHHIIEPSWYTSRRFEPFFFIKVVQTFIRCVLQLLLIPADVYHANEVTALPACAVAALLRRKPLIFMIYDLPFPVPETRVAFWRRIGGLITGLLAAILPHCAGVLATSPFHIQELHKRFHLTETPVSLIRNVPPYQSISKSDRLRRHLGLGPDVYIALYQGNIQPDRGLDALVRAAAFLQHDIVIVLMGRGVITTVNQLESLIASEGVADRVKILPPVPYAELCDWTASADIGLIVHSPNYSLNVRTLLPIKLFEYLMAGLPVLSSPLDAVVDVIRMYGVGRILPSLAPINLAAAINSTLVDREALERMHRNALCAAKEFCWEKESQHLIQLYHKVLVESGSIDFDYKGDHTY